MHGPIPKQDRKKNPTGKNGSAYYSFKNFEDHLISKIDENRKWDEEFDDNSLIPAGITPDGCRIWSF